MGMHDPTGGYQQPLYLSGPDHGLVNPSYHSPQPNYSMSPSQQQQQQQQQHNNQLLMIQQQQQHQMMMSHGQPPPGSMGQYGASPQRNSPPAHPTPGQEPTTSEDSDDSTPHAVVSVDPSKLRLSWLVVRLILQIWYRLVLQWTVFFVVWPTSTYLLNLLCFNTHVQFLWQLEVSLTYLSKLQDLVQSVLCINIKYTYLKVIEKCFSFSAVTHDEKAVPGTRGSRFGQDAKETEGSEEEKEEGPQRTPKVSIQSVQRDNQVSASRRCGMTPA